VLVWLEAATAKTKLEVAGWLPLAAGPGPASHLDLPSLRVAAARRTTGVLRLSAGGGLALSAGGLRHLQPRRDEPDLAFDVRQGDYGGVVVVRPAAGTARGLAFAGVRARRPEVRTTVD